MQLDIEELGPVRRRATIEVEAPRVDSAFSGAYNKIAQRVALPGFRRGRIPMSHLRKRYGRQVTADVTQDLLDQALRSLVQDEGLKILGRPEVDMEPAKQGTPFSAVFTFEIAPHIELLSPDTYRVEREKWTASEAVVDHEIEHLAERFSTLEPVEDRTTAQEGDTVVIDYRGEIDEIPFAGGTAQDAQLELGSGQFIPGFEDQLVGHDVGEEFTIDVSFPADYGAEELAGRAAVFHVTLKGLQTRVEPAIDEEFAQKIGFDDLAAFKARVKSDIEKQYDDRSAGEARKALRDEIGRHYDFEVPPILVESGMQDKKLELSRAAREDGEETEIDDSTLEAHREEVLREARAELVLDQIGDEQSIEVSPREVSAYVEQLTRQMGQFAEQFRQMYRDPNRRAGLRRRMRQDKVLDFLLSQANVTTVEKDVPEHDHGDDDHDHAGHDHDHDHDHGDHAHDEAE